MLIAGAPPPAGPEFAVEELEAVAWPTAGRVGSASLPVISISVDQWLTRQKQALLTKAPGATS